MINEILVCLDGSPLAEKVVPLARGIAYATGAILTGVKVVRDSDQIARAESYMRESARRFGAQIKFVVSGDPALAILEELEKDPTTLVAITTHGRTAWSEAVLVSVAFRVIRGAKRPVILYCPLVKDANAPKKVTTLVVALDGSDFSERIIPYAAAIKQTHGIDADWEVLHGDPADAICRYLKGMPDTLLAMTTHARSALERAVLGSVAGYCVRHAGVPLLLYWPHSVISNSLGW